MTKHHVTTIVAGFFIIILLMMLVLSLIFSQSHSVRDSLQTIGSSNQKSNLLTIMRESQLERAVMLRDIYLTKDPFQRDELKIQFYSHARKVSDAYESLQLLELTANEKATLEAFITIGRENRLIRNNIIDLLAEDEADIDVDALNEKFSRTVELERKSQRLLRELKNGLDSNITRDVDDTIDAVKTIAANHLILIIASVLLSLVIAYLVIRLVIKQTAVIESLHDNLEEKVIARTEELAIAKDEAETANREKSRFLANMSHELRTPMHAILSFTNLGLKKAEHEKVRRYLENIKSSATRLTSLLNGLLDLSKLEANQMHFEWMNHDILQIIQESKDSVSSLLQSRTVTVHHEENQKYLVETDKNLLMQVVINLLSNAIHYSPDDSQIDIHLEQDTSGNRLTFSITDNGIGIPQKELETVFDSFTQSSKTRSNAGGTGLGLPICREIILHHNGQIWAESPPKKYHTGTTIVVKLPIHQPQQIEDNADTISDADQSIQWTEDYSVGDEKLDQQHKKILGLINSLIQQTVSNNSDFSHKEILAELNLYINEHLRDEENYLIEKGYPFIEGHKDLHNNFCDRIEDFSAAVDLDPDDFLPKLVEFLRYWWDHHILEEDMRYKQYFESQ